jgi:hypothetical protein
VSEQPGRYQRSASGMIGAMVVLLLVIGAYVAFRAVNRTQPDNPVRPVDYQQTLTYARGQAGFPVLAPSSLPAGWRATSVTFVPRPVRWHLGILTNQDKYVGLEQSRRPLGEMVSTYVDANAVRDGAVSVDGEPWRRWTDAGGDTALTRVEAGVTTLVVSDAGQDVLVPFVRSLR